MLWDEAIPGDQQGSPGVGPMGLQREEGQGCVGGKVNRKGLLQVSFNNSSLKRDPGGGQRAKEKTGAAAVCSTAKIIDMLQEILNSRNKGQKNKVADTLLMFIRIHAQVQQHKEK